MRYAPLGSNGPLVSRIGLGLAALGRPGYINLGHGADLAARTSPEALENHARGVLDAARAAGVQAIETVFTDFSDIDGLSEFALAARREGFTGQMAIHPAQVEPINAAFAPGGDEIEQAERVIAAFEAEPGAGVVALDGRMVDRPHLLLAQNLLALRDAISRQDRKT